jgi:hypothetical protein
MANLVDLFVPPFWVGVICTVFYTAIDSPLRPVQSYFLSWKNAFSYMGRHYVVGLVLLLVFLVSPTLDFVFGKYLRLPGWQLMVAAWAWQALAAGILGFLAVRLHYYAFQDDPFAKRSPYVSDRRREWWAFGIGLVAFLLLLGANFGFAFLASLAPKIWLPLAHAASGWLRAVLFVPLALMRPCLSLGARRPIRSAFVGFSRRPISFLIWISALGVPAIFAKFAMESFVRPGNFAATPFWTAHAALVAFNVLNFIAFEMTTFRMARNLSWVPSEDFEVGRDQSL